MRARGEKQKMEQGRGGEVKRKYTGLEFGNVRITFGQHSEKLPIVRKIRRKIDKNFPWLAHEICAIITTIEAGGGGGGGGKSEGGLKGE